MPRLIYFYRRWLTTRTKLPPIAPPAPKKGRRHVAELEDVDAKAPDFPSDMPPSIRGLVQLHGWTWYDGRRRHRPRPRDP